MISVHQATRHLIMQTKIRNLTLRSKQSAALQQQAHGVWQHEQGNQVDNFYVASPTTKAMSFHMAKDQWREWLLLPQVGIHCTHLPSGLSSKYKTGNTKL